MCMKILSERLQRGAFLTREEEVKEDGCFWSASERNDFLTASATWNKREREAGEMEMERDSV